MGGDGDLGWGWWGGVGGRRNGAALGDGFQPELHRDLFGLARASPAQPGPKPARTHRELGLK